WASPCILATRSRLLACRRRARSSPPETAGTAGAGRDCPRAPATATRSPAADVSLSVGLASHARRRAHPAATVPHGVDPLNNSLGFAAPASMFRYFSKTGLSPYGINWGHYADPRVDGLLAHAGSAELRL